MSRTETFTVRVELPSSAEHAFAWLDSPVVRLCCPDTPIPYSPTLEDAYLPNVDKLVAKVRELASY